MPQQVVFGAFNFEVTSNAAKPKIGQLTLKYTLNDDGSITAATLEYNKPNQGGTQSIAVTVTGTSAPYSGVGTTEPLDPPWNVPGEGNYKYLTFSYTPTTGSANGTWTGRAGKDPLAGDENSINWEADASTATLAGTQSAQSGY
jgi:hypothetical protein